MAPNVQNILFCQYFDHLDTLLNDIHISQKSGAQRKIYIIICQYCYNFGYFIVRYSYFVDSGAQRIKYE